MPPETGLEAEIKAELSRIHDDSRRVIKDLRREVAAETKTYTDALYAAVEPRVAELREELDQVRTALNRRGFDAATPSLARPTEESKAFQTYVRRGREALGEEAKALHVGTDSAGGFLAPTQFVAEVLRVQREASPIRRLARNLNTERGSVEFPRQVTSTVATWVGELEARPATDMTFGSQEIPLRELATMVDVSLRLLEDAELSVESLMATDLGEAFAAAEGAAFLTGTGVKQPTGILSSATVGLKVVNSGNATAIMPDALISMIYAVGAQNSRTGTWLMSTQTAATIRRMKDSADRYLWADSPSGLTTGQPSTLLGRPVEIADDMPAVAAGATPVLFGDFARAAWVLNRPSVGLSILRDDFTIRGGGCVRFHARMRVGFGVVRPEALAKLRVAL